MTSLDRRLPRLGVKLAVGSMWVGAGRFLVRAADLLLLLILARILAPADFGLVAIAMSFVALLEAFTALPVGSALLRLTKIERPHLHTAFTLALLRACLLGAIVIAAATPFAVIYDDPRLAPLLFALSLMPFARGLKSPAMTLHVKAMNLVPVFVVDVVGKVAALVAAIIVALVFQSYWAIATASIAAPVASAIVSYILAPYVPRLSLTRWRDFVGFLGWTSAAQLFSALNWQFDRLFLGQVAPTSTVGLYAMANNMASIPDQFVLRPITIAPLLSSLSAVRGDKARLMFAFTKASGAILSLGLPMLVLAAVLADPAVRLLFDPRWADMAPLLTGLCLALCPALFRVSFRSLTMALDRTRLLFHTAMIDTGVRLPAMVVGYFMFEIWGIIGAIAMANIVTAGVSLVYVRAMIGSPLWRQLAAAWRPLVGIIIMGLIGSALARHLVGLDTVPLLFGLAGVVAIMAGLYVSAIGAFWCAVGRPEGIESLGLELVRRAMRKLTGARAPET